MSTIKSLSRNAIWLTIAEFLGKAIAFASSILITRYLSKEGFGQYSFVIAFGLIFGVLANFGFGAYTTREIAKNREGAEKIVGNLLSLKALLSVGVLVLLAITAQFIDRPDHVIYGLYIVGFITVFDALRSFVSSIFQAFEKMQYVTVVRVGERLLYVTLVILSIVFDYGIIALLVSLAASSFIFSVIGLLIVHYRFAKLSFRFDSVFIRTILLSTFYFVINDVFITIFFKIDSVMLSFFKGDVFNAEYTAAYNLIYSSAVVIPAVLSAVLYPVLTRFYNTDVKKFKENIPHILKYYIVISFPVIAFFMILAEPLLDIIYDGKYNDSVFVFQVLAVGVLFVFVNFVLSTILNTIEKQKLVAFASFIAMVVNVSLNVLFIPQWGILGAGVATVITELLFMLGLYMFVEKNLKLLNSHIIFKALRLVFVTTLASIAAFVTSFNVYVSFTVFAVVFIILLFAVGMFTDKDKNYVLQALNRG